jgi:hypothetical protein
MLLIGLLAAIWGFMMCFLPVQWDKLTETVSLADRWTAPNSKRLHSIIRLGNRIAGMFILAGGCWFAYEAIAEMYLVLIGRDTPHTVAPAGVALSNSPTPVLTTFSVLMILAGGLMGIFPLKVMAILDRVWPAGRSVRPSSAPRIALYVRLFGALLVLLAIFSLIH